MTANSTFEAQLLPRLMFTAELVTVNSSKSVSLMTTPEGQRNSLEFWCGSTASRQNFTTSATKKPVRSEGKLGARAGDVGGGLFRHGIVRGRCIGRAARVRSMVDGVVHLAAMNGYIARSFDSEAYFVSTDFNDGDHDLVVDHDAFIRTTGKNQHATPLHGAARPPIWPPTLAKSPQRFPGRSAESHNLPDLLLQ